jgi:tetrahydromethanopterin S-methyltransferase subunit G
MNELGIALIGGLSSNPAMLLLCVVLIGGGWVISKVSGKVIEGVFSRLDKFDGRLESIEDSLREIIVLKKDLEKVEERVDRIEATCDRRHEGK